MSQENILSKQRII